MDRRHGSKAWIEGRTKNLNQRFELKDVFNSLFVLEINDKAPLMIMLQMKAFLVADFSTYADHRMTHRVADFVYRVP